MHSIQSVSYTHLDVYKRQVLDRFYTAGADGAAFINRFMGDLTIRDSGCAARVRARAASGEIYGQVKGAYMFF